MQCCSNCIGDRGLSKDIIPFRSVDTGTCSYCGLKDQPLVNPSDLRNNVIIQQNN